MDCEAAMGPDQPGRRRRHQVWKYRESTLPGPAPHLRSLSLSSSHLSRTPRGGSTCPARGHPQLRWYSISIYPRRWRRLDTPICYIPTLSPILRVRGADQHSDTAAPDELQPPNAGRGRGTADGLGRYHWRRATASGHSPAAFSGGITTVLSSPDFPSGCKLPPPLQPPRLGALLPLPSCLLPVRSHLSRTL